MPLRDSPLQQPCALGLLLTAGWSRTPPRSADGLKERLRGYGIKAIAMHLHVETRSQIPWQNVFRAGWPVRFRSTQSARYRGIRCHQNPVTRPVGQRGGEVLRDRSTDAQRRPKWISFGEVAEKQVTSAHEVPRPM